MIITREGAMTLAWCIYFNWTIRSPEYQAAVIAADSYPWQPVIAIEDYLHQRRGSWPGT